MSLTVCLAPSPTLEYVRGGSGHLWVSLHWALGLEALGCRVIWLEPVFPAPADEVVAAVASLRRQLWDVGLRAAVAVFPQGGGRVPDRVSSTCLDVDAAAEADILISTQYSLPQAIVGRFAGSALIDIDPGLLQLWIADGQIELARYRCFFTTGETVGTPRAAFPDGGLSWQHTPPAVALTAWPRTLAGHAAPYTSVSHWWGDCLIVAGDRSDDGQRCGFLPYLDLPAAAPVALELAVAPEDVEEERRLLETHGWRVRDAVEVTATPARYRRYVQASRGELSCVKPSSVRLQNASISERTLCYLASGKPAIVEHTGPSRFLPHDDGLVRFRTPAEAAAALVAVEADYARHCRSARALAEEHFDAERVARRVLERVA